MMLKYKIVRRGVSAVSAGILSSLTALGCGVDVPVGADDGDIADIDRVEQAIVGGTADSTHNAVVKIRHAGASCTGALIKPDIVITNAHCIYHDPARDTPRADWGKWAEFPSAAGDATIEVGPSGASPRWVGRAHWVNLVSLAPDGAGHDDIALVGMQTPVPAGVATPMPVATEAVSVSAAADALSVAGWAAFYAGRTDARLRGTLRGPLGACSGLPNMRSGTWTGGTGPYEPGDSGSPVFVSSTNTIIGVMGNAACYGAGFNTTFTTGSAAKPDVRGWLKKYGQASLCSQQGKMSSADGRKRRLMNWWSADRADNFLTTQNGWYGCFNNWMDTVQGYGFNRSEGWLLSTPATGTVPVRLYWSSTTLDNATARDGYFAATSAWQPGPLLGHAYATPGTNRVALYLYYNSERRDYFTTTASTAAPGYYNAGLIGYASTVP
jgi:Trypsin